jgi:catechol 2,3-dioxygenase-like lactoylglutathione lyase family enzyme
MFQAEQLDHIALTVQDLERSISWYQTVLYMEQRYQYRDTTGRGTPVVLCSGSACVALFPSPTGQLITPLQGHIALRLTRENFDQAQSHLRQKGITFKFVEYTAACGKVEQDERLKKGG